MKIQRLIKLVLLTARCNETLLFFDGSQFEIYLLDSNAGQQRLKKSCNDLVGIYSFAATYHDIKDDIDAAYQSLHTNNNKIDMAIAA